MERTLVAPEGSTIFAKNIAEKMDVFECSGVKFRLFLPAEAITDPIS
jgi:hypothetical protein